MFFYFYIQAADEVPHEPAAQPQLPAVLILRQECALRVGSAVCEFRSLTDLQVIGTATLFVVSLICAGYAYSNKGWLSEEEKAANEALIISFMSIYGGH